MDKLALYRSYIKQILNYHSQFKSSYGEIDEYVSFDELFDLGVPKQAIVLAYQMPNSRKLTEFAVG